MVRVEKRVYNVNTGLHEWHPLGEAKTYKEAIEKYNGVQGWWMKREHEFFMDGQMFGTLCRMKKKD